MKRYNIIILSISFIILLGYSISASAQEIISGVVIDKDSGTPLENVNVENQDSGQRTFTDSLGRFQLRTTTEIISLQFTKIGYETLIEAFTPHNQEIKVLLIPQQINIEEIEINTGYQWIPRERATGSFIHVDQAQLERIPARSIMEKLDGIMPGIQFDKRGFDYKTPDQKPVVTVRGMNTFMSTTSAPLIVVDNFPYEGDISSINPNDVESVTMLRDAAATSIWGARAGNGVLVINLKKPTQTAKPTVSFSSHVSITGKPDLFYQPTMNSSDFVDVELFLYEKGHYFSALTGSNAYRTVFSPVVQALFDYENGIINKSELDQIISSSRTHDYRNDMLSHYYRNTVNRQHHVSLSMRNGWHAFRFSAGVDQLDGAGHQTGKSSNDQYSFSLNNSFHFNSKLQVEMNINYSLANELSGGIVDYPLVPGGGKVFMYPYLDLSSPESIVPNGLNIRFADTVGGGQLLDWKYNPHYEKQLITNENRVRRIHPMLILRYNPFKHLHLEAIYSGEFQNRIGSNDYDVDSYYVRDNINRYTQINGNEVIRPYPIGNVLRNVHSDVTGHKFRLQAKIEEHISERGLLSFVAGGELSDVVSMSNSYRVYGYDPFLMVSIPVDHTTRHPLYLGGNSTISSGMAFNRQVQRLISFYGNGSFIWDGKYIISASSRRDASNVFGAKSNERWNPLWSVGLSWNLHKESFIEEMSWISRLRLRMSHGHSGNLGGGTTSDRAVLINYGNNSYTGLPMKMITSPPNTALKWENVRMSNFAIDFALLRNQRIRGSVEYYFKLVTDLISYDPIDPTTGFSYMDRNVGSIKGKGLDVNMDWSLLANTFSWTLGTSFSYASDKVEVYNGIVSQSYLQVASGEMNVMPVPGKSLIPVYSYRYAGLDPQTGDPLGYQNGELSTDYARLTLDSLHFLNYHGSARPRYFGFMNHALQYKNLSLFVNVAFRAGHFVRKPTLKYSSLFNSWESHEDYENRWQQPGDEKRTMIPSMVYPANASRDNFYAGSDANIYRGDVIRLQQIRVSYRWSNPFWNIQNADFGVHANNVGIIWKTTKGNFDPDYKSIPPSRVVSLSVNLNF